MPSLFSLYVLFSMYAIDESSKLDIRMEVSRNLSARECMAIIAGRPSIEKLGIRGWEKQNFQFDLFCKPANERFFGRWLRQAPKIPHAGL